MIFQILFFWISLLDLSKWYISELWRLLMTIYLSKINSYLKTKEKSISKLMASPTIRTLGLARPTSSFTNVTIYGHKRNSDLLLVAERRLWPNLTWRLESRHDGYVAMPCRPAGLLSDSSLRGLGLVPRPWKLMSQPSMMHS